MHPIKVITVATSEHPYLDELRKSCVRHGMDLTVLGLGKPWRGFGMKIIETYEYLKTLEGYTHFIFVDAYDTLFLKPIKEVPNMIIFSCEKHKWPDPNIEYPDEDDEYVWKYINSGAYSAPISEYLKLIEDNPVKYEDDDQRYFTKLYLDYKIRRDVYCITFQSYAFEQPGDFTLSPTFKNNITGTEPAIIHFNGKCHDERIYKMQHYNTLREAQLTWKDDAAVAQEMNESFATRVNLNDQLNDHRTFVEQNIWGFGERSFHWMWNLIIQEMPKEFTFLEIGVLKGQTLSLALLLANMQGKKVKRYGVTPLSTEGGVWEADYKAAIEFIHDRFDLKKDYTILQGLSEDPEIIKQASGLKLDILYIDGGHEERHVINDIEQYSPLVRKGGYMVIDDACNTFQMPWGYFQGIESVTRIVDQKLPPRTANPEWEFVFSVVHNRVYRKL